MIEPTETEARETLDDFAWALDAILAEAEEDPEIARNAPYVTPIRRMDEVAANRNPVVRQALGRGAPQSSARSVPAGCGESEPRRRGRSPLDGGRAGSAARVASEGATGRPVRTGARSAPPWDGMGRRSRVRR